MVDSITATKPLAPFTTVQYEKNGEKLTATKNNGVVTVVGEKSGTRYMSVQEFITNELPKLGPLEKTPEKDVVEISNKKTETTNTTQTTENTTDSDKKINIVA